VKILDFGLAKLKVDDDKGTQTDLRTISGTEPGVVLGTMGYMSPEQVRGKPADRRSDIFAFGAILYEMLSGQRAFRGDTAADTITAILTKEPPDLSQTNKEIHPGLDRIVRHCLEKNPEERFESARDVAFDLRRCRPSRRPRARFPPRWPPRRPRRSAAAGPSPPSRPRRSRWRREPRRASGSARRPDSFRRRAISSSRSGAASSTPSRFAPDGQTVIYAAGVGRKAGRIFATATDRPESRVFGLAGAEVASISKAGEMLVLLDRHVEEPFIRAGTLAQVSVSGGVAPRSILGRRRVGGLGP
jgi:serine/threonine protein kinase